MTVTDEFLHEQTATTTLADADILLAETDVSGTPIVKYITWANLKTAIGAALGAIINALTGKTTPVDNDYFVIGDSAASNASKKLTWANVKATLKTYFDGVYNQKLSTTIEGLKLTWNSATSVTVGIGFCYAENGDQIPVTSALVKSGLSLSNSTWYHIYVYLSTGVAAAEVVTTAPAAWKATAYSKTSDTSRRYVGSIRTDSSGNVYEFTHSVYNNMIMYSGTTVVGSSPHRALNAGTATTATEVSLSSVIPVTSRTGYLRMFNLSDKVVSFGDTSAVNGVALNVGNTAAQNFFGPAPLTSTPGHYYKLASAAGAGGAYVDVYGYFFER
jgi:hypothetical protein